MRILHLIGSLAPKVGGPAEGLKRIHQSCASFGYDLEAVCLDSPADEHLRQLNFPVHAMGPAKGTYGYTPRLQPWLEQNAQQYDGVVVNGLWQFHGLAAWKALRHRAPYFVFTHGMLDPWFKQQYPAKHVKKLAYWSAVERHVLNDAEAVLFTAEAEQELARRNFYGHQWQGTVVPYGALGPQDLGRDYKRMFLQRFPDLLSKRILLYLGRLHEKKGCDLLLHAFAKHARQHPDLHLVMAGPDASGYQAKLRALADEKGIADRVHWTGILTGDLKWGAFQSCEAFVLPSHQENFGIAVAEALSCGRPVLITDKVNIWRPIVEDGAGFAESDDQKGIDLLLRRWLVLDEQAVAKMRIAAYSSFERRFNIQNCGRRLLALFAEAKERAKPGQIQLAA